VSDLTPSFLKTSAQMEPLFNRWYAWAHLVAPATAALNVANHHVRLMRSFVNAPQIHVAAVRNPAMRGGPFLDLDPARAGEVDALLRRTENDQRRLIDLAEALTALNELLVNEANGGSLADMYGRVPDLLRGHVELVYDLNCRATFRLLEALLYRSPFYDRSLQSLSLSLAKGRQRPFVFSTPRLPGDGQLDLRVPFASPAIDELSKMRMQPKPAGFVRELFGLGAGDDEAVARLLTDEVPAPPQAPPAATTALRVRYLGHACLLFETADVSVLVDPLVGYTEGQGVCFTDLPERIDYVLITHTHSDHVVLETLLQLRHRVGTVVVPRSSGSLEDPSLRLALEAVGFRDVRELDDLQTIDIPGGAIIGVPFFGEHGDLNIRSKTAHLLRLGGQQILCTADSANLEPRLYEWVHAAVGDVDLLFVGMECDGAPLSWMYGGLLMRRLERKMDQSRRLCASDAAQALEIVRKFKAKRVFVYAMGQEEWLSFITSIRYTDESKPIVESNKLLEACRAQGVFAERLLGTKEIRLD